MAEPRYFAFLRAINTGTRRLTNDALLEPFHDLGFTDIAAYQAAGNVTFRCGDPDQVAESRIEEALGGVYGFATPTFVRTADEIAAIASAAPFGADELAASDGKTQVAFLRSVPSSAAIAQVTALVPAEDRAVLSGREWYWLPVAGVGRSALPVAEISGLLGDMTMRTLGTVERMTMKFPD